MLFWALLLRLANSFGRSPCILCLHKRFGKAVKELNAPVLSAERPALPALNFEPKKRVAGDGLTDEYADDRDSEVGKKNGWGNEDEDNNTELMIGILAHIKTQAKLDKYEAKVQASYMKTSKLPPKTKKEIKRGEYRGDESEVGTDDDDGSSRNIIRVSSFAFTHTLKSSLSLCNLKRAHEAGRLVPTNGEYIARAPLKDFRKILKAGEFVTIRDAWKRNKEGKGEEARIKTNQNSRCAIQKNTKAERRSNF
ncbi:hypothetical protein FRC09_011020 [Ceratobasidium sp. 395]|nr:hypothetical protein FRC09_011020 [Ceratobasidium sp. 395]